MAPRAAANPWLKLAKKNTAARQVELKNADFQFQIAVPLLLVLYSMVAEETLRAFFAHISLQQATVGRHQIHENQSVQNA